MSKISITIDGIKCEAVEGEYILNVARRNNIFIPALCYLSGCSPTLACRLCMADVDGKRAYTCNAKAKDGQVIVSSTPEIEEERRSIMEVYCINHPLECGVCDQSGECELQNYVHAIGVNNQHYTIANTHKPVENWGLTRYDASLCIMCERCVTVCKDRVGCNALKTVPRGEGLAVPKENKDSMPKDAFAVWNRLQKSIIAKVEDVDCGDCGACAEVCPVGALVVTGFHYKSNSWELQKIPAANPHSSDCSLIYYEVKQISQQNSEEKIYRVEGEQPFNVINGAARFGYDFENRVKEKDENSFNEAISFIKTKADTIKFNSYITNEEALILQKIKEKYNLKLVNDDAFRYQRFLNAFSSSSTKSLYQGSLKEIEESNFIVSVGTALRYDFPNGGYAFNTALKMNKASGIYAHPIADKIVEDYSKNLLSLQYKVGSEEAMFYLLLELCANKSMLDEATKEYLNSLHVKSKRMADENVVEEIIEKVIKKIQDETGDEREIEEEVPKKVTKVVQKEVEYETTKLWELAGLEDFKEKVETLKSGKDRFSLIIGEDLLTHKNWENLAILAGTIERTTPFSVTIIPPQTNTLGVALLCELDEFGGENTLGYNEKGSFTLSALGDGELDMPSLNQQEGTFTSIDKRVVPTNAALGYKGYILNDLANALGIRAKYTIDYTKELPDKSGYIKKEFDELPNYFDNGGTEHRGYLLHLKENEVLKTPKDISTFELSKNTVYKKNPVLQFNAFTNKALEITSCAALYASEEFLHVNDLRDGQSIKLVSDDGKLLSIKVKLDKNVKGLIPSLPTFDTKVDVSAFFKDGYRFGTYEIKGADNE
ncbi:MAG: NADH-quinone oxidoreductase subunit G [Campylobacteraceae bacterium]